MIAEIDQERTELERLCRRYAVLRLELFGSAVDSSTFDSARSDLDFLVEFQPSDTMGPADQYFGLWEDLKQLFRRDVDLVSVRSLRNPYFIASINRTRRLLYAS